MRHVGLVISDTLVSQELIRNHVVEFVINEQNEYSHLLASVAEAAFRFEANGTLDLAFVKNQRRRAELPLLFGDVIEWSEADMKNNRVILKFRRMPELFEHRVYDQKFQVLVSGVVSPIDKFHFWSEYFPHVRLGMKSSEEVLPNVGVAAWLNLCTDEDGRFCVEFDSFERVEHEARIIAAAPWNRNNPKYTTLALPSHEDGLESQILLPDSLTERPQWQQEVFNLEGICTGKRLIFCRQLSSYEIVVALIKNAKESIPFGIGVSCEFSAVWNEYEKRFIVTKYKTKGLPSRLGSNGLLRTSVKAVENYPGLFKSDQFGLIDDPRGVLALLHLSAYKRSSVVVTLEDKPVYQSDMRFRIVDVQPDKAPKLEKWMEESEITIEDSEGVVVDAATVYSKDHGNIFFDVPEDLRSNLSPGKLVKFSAQYQHNIKRCIISKIVLLPEDEVPSVEKILSHDQEECQRVFLIEAMRPKYFRSCLESSVFGLVALGSHISLPRNKSSKFTVWVTRSVPETEAVRSARTPFMVLSIGDLEPPDYLLSPPVDVTSLIVPESPQEEPATVPEKPKKRDKNEIQAAMERLGLIGDKEPTIIHSAECTDTSCATDCPTMSAVMMLTEEVEDLWEMLSTKNPTFFTECVNKLFT
uniref:Alpha-mannosidase n=1 Tax=Haemonchus contortus TaxID=6289 RepID=A0A7I4YK35_HAECO